MATFPTLTPSSRTFTPGRHPHSEISTLNGLQTRVRTSNVILEQQLRLTFMALTEAQMLSIRSHYIGQQGRFLSFAIPDSLLSGMTTPSYFTPTGYSWIYANPPQVEDIPGTQRYTVSIELITIPPEGANINGFEFAVSVGLTAGLASTAYVAAGADLTVTASLASGVVADNTSAGLAITVPASMVSGAATGEAGSNDPNFSSVSLLLHLDGANNSTTFTDSSSNNRTVTASGSAKLSTAVTKFGSASLNCNSGSDANITTAANILSVAASQDFTVEFWLYPTQFATGLNGSSTYGIAESQGGSDWMLSMGDTAGVKKLVLATDNATIQITHQTNLVVNTWQHIAAVRSSNVFSIYIDGVKSSASYTRSDAFNNSSFFSFGPRQAGASNRLYMDDIRFTTNVARYTATFTPPTTAFPDS